MAIKPFLHCVLVRPLAKEEIDPLKKRTKENIPGFIFETKNDTNRERAGVDRGIVIDIGPTAWKDFKTKPPCKVGDTVLFTKHAGTAVEDDDGELYLLMTDQDIFGGFNVTSKEEVKNG